MLIYPILDLMKGAFTDSGSHCSLTKYWRRFRDINDDKDRQEAFPFMETEISLLVPRWKIVDITVYISWGS